MDDWYDRVCPNLREVPSLVDVFVHFTDDGDVVSAKDVETENDLKTNTTLINVTFIKSYKVEQGKTHAWRTPSKWSFDLLHKLVSLNHGDRVYTTISMVSAWTHLWFTCLTLKMGQINLTPWCNRTPQVWELNCSKHKGTQEIPLYTKHKVLKKCRNPIGTNCNSTH